MHDLLVARVEQELLHRIYAVSRAPDGYEDLLRRLCAATRRDGDATASLRLREPNSPSSPGLRFHVLTGAAKTRTKAHDAEAESLRVCHRSGRCRRVATGLGGWSWSKRKREDGWCFVLLTPDSCRL
uniref:Uncharacterized protein n=1 Tax=Mycena chlorophos TaxID=658473 RepID=A0ABQ0LBP2_MYCCL|nr:predicted protein [Mycena chlorophos]